MAIQTINLGTAPSGAGGDTNRSANVKINANFTDNVNAASRLVGTSSGNVMQVGAFGLGGLSADSNPDSFLKCGFSHTNGSPTSGFNFLMLITATHSTNEDYCWQLGVGGGESNMRNLKGRVRNNGIWSTSAQIFNSHNATVDSNGFIKAASPIVRLFAEKIELNDEAKEQAITLEKISIGHYLIKDSSGFAKDGWWIEIPTDTNGNKICAVEYQTLENSDLEIKTFKKKLNEDGDIVANLDAPIDIPSNSKGEPRWIDIRLNEIKKPVVHKVPRTTKQPRMIQQMKYAPQVTYITKLEDLVDDKGEIVIVDGKPYQKPVSYIHTDQNGTPILTDQPVVNEKGEVVFEWVQAVDSEDNPIFDDIEEIDADGNVIYEEVTYDPE
ncbi:phage tail fiber protein [Acinetobacter guerrae]|uniref:phage tail fiber protein n=1 Tax=Acinetobacter guerrae TaxID=1843371 RepID=UPI00125EF6BB|nr:hypothetical protein [Acinetobacter guerrae]